MPRADGVDAAAVQAEGMASKAGDPGRHHPAAPELAATGDR
jgi:hypothetical protein